MLTTPGNNEYLMEGFQDTTHDLSSIALAFYDGLWAYDGWSVFFVYIIWTTVCVRLYIQLYLKLSVRLCDCV